MRSLHVGAGRISWGSGSCPSHLLVWPGGEMRVALFLFFSLKKKTDFVVSFPSAFVYTLQPDSGYDYLLGRELHGYVDEKAGLIFGCCFDVELAVKLQNVYLSQNRACRSTIDAWSIVGMRFGVCKDVRVLIAKLVVDLTLPPRILPELAKRILKHKPATNTWKDFVYEGR